ncbi:MAG TPA: CHAT domain-containing protein [Longimicrobium sp.]|nr:CHAT domain-containing protein [Longimicrobium sp.]
MVLALLVDGGGPAPWGFRSPRRLEAVLLSQRFTAGRLSGQQAWQPCLPEPGEALVPRARCARPPQRGTRRFRRLSATALDLRRRLARGDSTAQLRAAALGHLRRGEDVDAAVAALERAATRSPGDARVLNDLAVAYLEQGARDQLLRPVLRALDTVERALERDSLMPEALYNRAVIRERLYLVKTARTGWLHYAEREPDRRWRAEARQRAAALEERDTTGWQTLVDARPLLEGKRRMAQIAPRVAHAPNQARDFSFELLGRWGAAVIAGREAEARWVLGWVRDLGSVADSLGGDRTVSLAIGAIDSARADPRRTRVLAAAQLEMASGFTHYSQKNYDSAAATLGRAEAALRELSPGLAGWAAYVLAASLIWNAQYEPADSVLNRITSSADPVLQPALVGRATWALGTSQVRRGYSDNAGQFYRAARPHLDRAREPEYQGAIHMLLSESLALAGQHQEAGAESYHGLRQLSAFPRSTYYNTQLTIVGLAARRAELRHAALSMMREKVEVTRASQSADGLALALRAQARARAALGDSAGAAHDAHEAARIADALPAGNGRERVVADVQVVLAELEAARDAHGALARLEKVIATYRQLQLGVYIPETLAQAASAARSLGRLDAAHGYLADAVQQVETLQDSAQTVETRISRLETLESVFDAMISLELERGRPASAFAYLERARLAAWPRQERGGRPGEVSLGQLAPERIARIVPSGTLLLEYAVLPDRLVIWTASGRGVRHFVAPLPRDTLARLVESFAGGEYRTSAGGPGTRLFQVLLGTVAGELAGIRHLVVVPDRELNQVPFAALRDERGGYLVDRYSVSTLPSAAFFIAARARARIRAVRPPFTLAVGEPAVSEALRLAPLPAAASEALAVSRLREPATLLIGGDARRDSVVRLLPHYTVFHFAGHAVFNAERPELSYLALAPDSAGHSGLLHAREIGSLPATNLETVVLSACSTMSPRPTHAGAPAGLAYSFLRAGAPATVSTLWDVSDKTTIEVLVEFHRRVAAGTPAAEALRLAQVAALRSDLPALRAPVAWAAFIYTGP